MLEKDATDGIPSLKIAWHVPPMPGDLFFYYLAGVDKTTVFGYHQDKMIFRSFEK
jgi:hypothetical protein